MIHFPLNIRHPTLLISLQLIVTAVDEAIPEPCMAPRNASIRLRVYRNLNAPKITDDDQYNVRVNEDAREGSRVVSVRSIDEDTRVF